MIDTNKMPMIDTNEHPKFPLMWVEQKTLRDEFAMAALQGLIANKGFYPTGGAADCYRAAEAMLAERQKT